MNPELQVRRSVQRSEKQAEAAQAGAEKFNPAAGRGAKIEWGLFRALVAGLTWSPFWFGSNTVTRANETR